MKETSASSPAMDWFYDRYQTVFVSRNRWMALSFIVLVLAVCQGLALVMLVPLKTVVPYLVKEETSGAVMTVEPMTGSKSVTYDEAVRKYFLAMYVRCRETYDPMDLRENYRTVDLMSDDNETERFRQYINPKNKQSPVAVYASGTKRQIALSSIVFLNDHTAQVHLSALEFQGSAAAKTSHWIATVSFRFDAPPTLESERLVNPLGFLVTTYRIDQEVVS